MNANGTAGDLWPLGLLLQMREQHARRNTEEVPAVGRSVKTVHLHNHVESLVLVVHVELDLVLFLRLQIAYCVNLLNKKNNFY